MKRENPRLKEFPEGVTFEEGKSKIEEGYGGSKREEKISEL